MFQKSQKSHLLIAAALAVLATAPAAAAARQIAVSYSDLDLATSAGQSELNSRIETAAASLCSPALMPAADSEATVREHQIVYRACIGRLTARALAGVKAGRN